MMANKTVEREAVEMTVETAPAVPETSDQAVESPVNVQGEAGGELAELEQLLDQHWRLLTITEKVRAIVGHYACHV
jgi:hypothetical protein